MVVRVAELLAHVLGNPKSYPGPHNQPQERTSKGYQKLDPPRQVQLIWEGIISRLDELLLTGKSVSIPSLGTFSYVANLHDQKFGADKVSKKPTFIPSNELKYACPNYSCKEELNVDPDALTAAQSCPGKVRFLNEVPIAGGCFLRSEVVKSAMKQIFAAVVDLAERNYRLELDMGSIFLIIKNQSVECKFSKKLTHHHAEPISIGCFNTGNGPKANSERTGELPRLSESWKKPEFSDAMSTFLPKPNSDAVHATRVAVANLDIMSRDLTTCQ